MSRTTVREIRRHEVPAWWRDAKLGLFVHWTPASVPAFAPVEAEIGELMARRAPDAMAWSPYAEWYQNSLRWPSSPAARHHAEVHHGRSYYDFGDDWEAGLESWDPDGWADRFAASGARYVVLVAKHHDGYCLWPTKVPNPRRPGWNSHRDVVGELAEAVRARGLAFGLYYSGGLDWTFNEHPIGTFSDLLLAQPRGGYVDYAEAQVRELIDRYRPSVLWNDISWPATASRLARLFGDYYRDVPDGVVNDRFMPWSPLWRIASTAPARWLLDRAAARAAATDAGIVPPRPPMFDVRTPEYTVFAAARAGAWECVRGIDRSFGHNRASSEEHFAPQHELLWSLIDIVAKGGNLLLNVGPRGEDATIAPAQLARLGWLGELTSRCGDALYASRPWVHAAGTSAGCEVRYTARDQSVFCFVRPAEGSAPAEAVTLREVRPGPRTSAATTDGSPLRCEPATDGLTVWLDSPATRARPGVLTLRGVVAARV
ncbi:MAG: alpha-L-fucosidase [Acidimicrobiales bacterium]|jgi:alpha-L-fucosidase